MRCRGNSNSSVAALMIIKTVQETTRAIRNDHDDDDNEDEDYGQCTRS